MPRYYIISENIWVPEELKGTQAIIARNTDELLSNIIDHYGFHMIQDTNIELQLWTGPMGESSRRRLDVYDRIPSPYEFLWMRGVNYTDIVVNS